jgi:signal transduction histidine kinase
MALPLSGAVNLSAFYIYFDLLALVTMLLLSITLSIEAMEGHGDLKLLALGFWLLYAVLLFNGLTAHGFLPFTPRSEYLGPLLLGICFAVILSRRHSKLSRRLEKRTRELETINANLETMVEARTIELQNHNQAKDQFFAIIGHDLKAPIGTLHHLLQEYEKDGTDVPREDVSDMRETCGRIYQLLESLLAWARGQQGKLIPQKQAFHTHQLAEDAIATLQRQAAEKQIRIEVVPHDRIHFSADKSMLTTVLRNLVANAIKFTPRGGRIRIEFTTDGDCLRCTCSDNGLGMSDEQLDGLFRPKDYASISVGTSGEKGSGLGLLLCEEFIHAHGGTISAEHEASGGTVVWFTLPTGVEKTSI